ncbi:oxidoreductase [Rhodopseudomonas palustris]|uniref:Oxidoreductase n=1 Tax=Rhodopseudomonas palustris TaxID=1076 RepID=A0A323UQ25_RHOPL|nr:3-oxoacyl-ACP reductase family protein [Rhodopseudomonas palustris]PZA13226.1 oxidoreductase [Rhodopseudomonas palustris]
MVELAGKRALVTGASRGIGAGIAVELAAKGADVVITYERSAERAAEVVRAIEGNGRRGFAIQANSADPAALKSAVDEAAVKLGGLDILVNNAGIGHVGPITELGLADLDALLNVNVRAVVLASQAAIPHLREGGRIISIGSTLAERVPFAGSTVYAMTKSALHAFTRGLSRELGPHGVTVNLVQPGSIDTDMNPANGEQADQLRALTALGRYGKPEEIAAVVAFLASPAAGLITGAMITADAGFSA